ncbi:MAG: hypothetical protein Q7Q73_02410 [Verrucomicrobiota bacterium JB024]|nr:hypothetical protein [Verrucomicrobiota bacterium JB024]
MKFPASLRTAALVLLPLLTALPAARGDLVIRYGEINNPAIFGVLFPNDLSFYGRADMVYAISIQQYQTGPYLVTEMVVDIGGVASQFRVYATEPFDEAALKSKLPAQTPKAITQQQGVPPAVQKLRDRAQQTADPTETGLVVKDYPVATHAKTIEYRLGSAKDVHDLYEAMMDIYIRNGREAVVSRRESVNDSEEVKQVISRLGGTLFVFE